MSKRYSICSLIWILFLIFTYPSQADLAEIPVDLTADGVWILTTNELRAGLTLHQTATQETFRIANTPGAGYYASFSPSGNYVCYKRIGVDSSGKFLFTPCLYRIDKRQTIPLAEPARVAGTPAISKDGRIAFTTGTELIVLDSDRNQIFQTNLGYHVNLLAFSPDGSSLVFSDDQQELVSLDLNSREIRQITSDGEQNFWGASFSPAGDYLLFQSAEEKIYMQNLKSKQMYSLGQGNSPAWVDDNQVAFINKNSDGRKVTATEIKIWNPGKKAPSTISSYPGEIEARFCNRRAAVFGQNHASLQILNTVNTRTEFKPQGWELQIDTDQVQEQSTSLPKKTSELAQSDVVLTGVPTVHQVYDTPDWFNGHWACGATSACMALAFYDLLDPWNVTASSPYSHVSPYGRYICETYTYNGYTFNIPGDDPNGTPATGGYGYIIQGDWEDTKGHMAEYIQYHGPDSYVDWSPTITEARTEIDQEHPFVVLNLLTTSGHYITCIGYVPDQHTLIFNDPYGNKNTSGYPSYDGTAVYYDWPGYNNGYQNLNTVGCYIYARMDRSPRFTNAIENGGFEQDFDSWSKGGLTSNEIVTSGVHRGSKACRFYRSDGYATIWQNPYERTGEVWRTTCYAYAYSDTTSPAFGYKDQSGNTESSVVIGTNGWEFCSTEWTISDDIDVQSWCYNSSNGVLIDDVRAGKASRMNWITDWCCCGPFPATLQTDHLGDYGGEAAIIPRPGLSRGETTWSTFSKPDGFMNLNDWMGDTHDPCVSYAHVYVISQQALDNVCLVVGADDGIQVLLNGVSIHVNDANSAQDYFNPDEDVIEGLHLNAGENRLMIKVRDAGGAYSFSARLCDAEGDALSGISYALSSQFDFPPNMQLY